MDMIDVNLNENLYNINPSSKGTISSADQKSSNSS
jgi:hypothetical protein